MYENVRRTRIAYTDNPAGRFQSVFDFTVFGKTAMPRTRMSANESHAAIMFIEKPPAIKPTAEQNAINIAYGICVATCSR